MAFPTDLLVVEKLKRLVELGKPRALDVFPHDIRWSHQNKK